MRTNRTPAELHAVSALCSALQEDGDTVEQMPGFTDRPDAAIRLNDHIVAVECTTFTSERLLRLHGIDMPEDKPFQIYVPLEPHMWLHEAIEAKAKKVPVYLTRCGAESAWLILHSARGLFQDLSELFNGIVATSFHIGVWSFPHPFERIYLTGEYNLPPVCIFRAENEATHRDKYAKVVIERIPIQWRYLWKVRATEAPNGQGRITLNFNQAIERRFLLQPLDRRFRADYTEITRVENALVAQQTLPSIIYAERVISVERELP